MFGCIAVISHMKKIIKFNILWQSLFVNKNKIMYVAGLIKSMVIVCPKVLSRIPVQHFIRVGQSCNVLRWQMTTLIPPSSGFRQFSCTCVTNFRTANSFICHNDDDGGDSETPGKNFSLLSNNLKLLSLGQAILFVLFSLGTSHRNYRLYSLLD